MTTYTEMREAEVEVLRAALQSQRMTIEEQAAELRAKDKTIAARRRRYGKVHSGKTRKDV